jgi:hypothetical protein
LVGSTSSAPHEQTAIRKPPSTAEPNPSTSRWLLNEAVMPSSPALTTSRNKPSVSTISGRLSSRNTGPRIAFTIEKITEIHSNAPKPP